MKRGRAPLAPFPRFWAAAALAGLALVWSSIGGWRPRPLLAGDAVMGEQLLHGLVRPHAGVSWTMPLNTVWMALASGGGGAAASALWVLPSLLLPLLLFALGWLLGSAPGALLAALTFAWIPGLMEIGNYAQSAYAVFVLLAAGLLVWRARRPGPGRDLAAGLAIGASLLFRSALAFFPPLLFAVEWLAAPRAAKPGRAAFAALVLVPYLFLLPWLAANRATEHRWIPFEDHRADMNVALGALGVVPNAEGEWRQMLPDPPDFSASGSVWLWAARESLRHPLRTARGYGARLAYVFSFEPLLFLALLAAAAAFWRSKEYRALLTLIAYFVGIHCFMTISRSYMTPLWPLAAAAAAARLRWPPRLERGGENAGDRAAAGLLLGCLAAALLACAAVLALVAAYPRRAARRPADAVEDYEAALAASPGDAWLMTRLGHQLLKRGETARASALLERAAELRPGDDEATLGRAWAETLLGRPRLMSAWSCGPSCDHETFLESFFLRSFALMKAGEPAQARASALAGLAQWEASTKTIGRLANEREAATLNALHPRSLISILLEPLQEMDLKDRERLLEEIAGLAAPRDAGDVWRELAADAQAVGDVRTAARARARMDRTSWQGSALPARPMSLPSADSHPPRARAGAAPADVAAACAAAGPDPAGFARRFPGDAEGLSAVAQCLARAGRLRPALAYADMLARAAGPAGGPAAARALWVRAGVERRLGDEPRFAADLRRAASLDPSSAELELQLARLLMSEGRTGDAIALLERGGGAPGGASAAEKAGLLTVRGLAELRLGRGARGRADLAQALLSDPDAACSGLPELDDVPAAAYDACVRARPREASLRVDRGVARYRAGDAAGAETDFRVALRLEPGSLEAALSLSVALEARGESAAALRALDLALASAVSRRASPAYAQAEAERDRLKRGGRRR